MATYYGVPFTGSDPNAYVQVGLPTDRTGLVTTPGILTATAGDVAYTHPVHRGHWVTQKITCTPAVAAAAEHERDVHEPVDVRRVAARRRSRSTRATRRAPAATRRMDALGLGLENYDMFGKWRTTYPNVSGTIDASGTLPPPSGKPFTDGLTMYADLAVDDGTRACLAQQVMAYVLTRALTSTGRPVRREGHRHDERDAHRLLLGDDAA